MQSSHMHFLHIASWNKHLLEFTQVWAKTIVISYILLELEFIHTKIICLKQVSVSFKVPTPKLRVILQKRKVMFLDQAWLLKCVFVAAMQWRTSCRNALPMHGENSSFTFYQEILTKWKGSVQMTSSALTSLSWLLCIKILPVITTPKWASLWGPQLYQAFPFISLPCLKNKGCGSLKHKLKSKC
jgi:hypothetical protein